MSEFKGLNSPWLKCTAKIGGCACSLQHINAQNVQWAERGLREAENISSVIERDSVCVCVCISGGATMPEGRFTPSLSDLALHYTH